MLQFHSIRVVLVLTLLLNTAPTATFGQQLPLPPLDIGRSDEHSAALSSSRSAAVASSHRASTLAGSVPVDNVTLEGSSLTATTHGSAATSRVSVASDGAQGDGPSGVPRISADGRYVVFSSQARNLVSGDTNGVSDIFVHDGEGGETTRVSVTSGGGQGDGPSFIASISADGRYVAFRSMASNLVAGDANNQDDVFLHDRDTQETIRISVGPGGVEGDGPSIKPVISADGNYVAFESWATNLVIGDNNGQEDVFLYNRQTREIIRVSVAPGGAEANDESDLPAISDDGRYVAFASEASNLVVGDNNNVCDTNGDGVYTDNCPDVFVYDWDTGQIQRVSVGSGGTQALGWSAVSSLSADGRYVAFESQANDLVTGDSNGVWDIFVHDRQTSQTWRVSVDSNGREGNGESRSPSISADGRYVAFVSWADNLVAGDTNGTSDVFVHDRQTGQTVRVSVASDGRQGNDSSGGPSLSTDGRYVAFSSFANTLVSGDTNGQEDVFIRDRGTGLGNTIRLPLVSGSDDAGVEMNCSYRLDWREAYFGRCNDGSPIVTGFRFRHVPIAAGAVISEAHLEFTVDGPYANGIAVEILGQASANSAPFTDIDRPSDRPLTTSSIGWNIPASDAWSAEQSRLSPNVAPLIQEIVNLPGWASGNSLAIIIRANPAVAGNSHRRVFAWEREESADRTARLVVTYQDSGAPPPLTSTFIDVPIDHWAHDSIEMLYQAGITAPCNRDPLMYCPDGSMNRAESAVFLAHGIHGINFVPTQPVTQAFADVPLDSWAAKWVTAGWQEGYTSGCDANPLRYCPWQTHTRAEGSVLYLRLRNGTSYLPPDPAGIFVDVPVNQWYARWVEAAYNAGLILACQTAPELRFCPNDPMTRAMSAYAIAQAKSLSDITPPDGRITSPADGSAIGPGTASVFIRADAWDNPGGSGVAKVRFYVEYDGVRNHVCTDTDDKPSCTWTIPAGLTSQQLVFTINVLDRAGNIKANAGGPIYVNYQAEDDGDGGGRDATPPDGRITSPQDGDTIPFDTGSILIRAEAWDNPGGSGVARVGFYVEYDGVRHRVCTKSDPNPSCTWSIPAGLASQTLIFTIKVVDRAGNIQENAGGPVYITIVDGDFPRLTASPTSVPADGTSRSTITLSNAPVGHQVRLISSRGGADIFENATGTVNSSGQYITTIRSSKSGMTEITAKDLTTNQMFAASVRIDLRQIDDPTPTPIPQPTAPVITDVRPQYPLDAVYLQGISLQNRIDVTVDWKGNTPNHVDFTLSRLGHLLWRSVPTNSSTASTSFDMGKDLRPGNYTLRIVAHDATGQPSQAKTYTIRQVSTPAWILAGITGGILFSPVPSKLSGNVVIKWGFKYPFKNVGLFAENFGVSGTRTGLSFRVEGDIQLPLTCSAEGKLTVKATAEKKFEYLNAKIGGELEGSASSKLGPNCIRLPLTGTWKLSVYGEKTLFKKTWIDALVFLNYALYISARTIVEVLHLQVYVERIGQLRLDGRVGVEIGSGIYSANSDPKWAFRDFEAGGGLGLKGYLASNIGVAEVTLYAGGAGKVFARRPGLVTESSNWQWDRVEVRGEAGAKFRVGLWTRELKGEVVWKYPSAARSVLSAVDNVEVNDWHLITRAYPVDSYNKLVRIGVHEPAPFAVETGVSASNTVSAPIVTNVFLYAEPDLALRDDNQALLLWTHDDLSRPIGQGYEVQYSRWNGSTWSSPAKVVDDIYPDFSSQVAWVNDGRAVAVWQRLNDTLPITATWDVTTANKIEIATAAYNPISGTWSPVSLLTANDVLDLTPRLARNETGRLLAVWRQNPAGLLSGDEANPDRIMMAFYDSGWSAPSVAVPNIPGLVDLAAGYGDGAALIAFTQYVTPTGYPTPTLHLFTAAWSGGTWSTPLQRTDDNVGHRNPQVVYNAANQPLVAWLAGDELRLRNLATGDVVDLILPADIGNVDEFRIVQDGAGNIAAVFTTQVSQRDLYVAFYDQVHNLWGNPTHLTADRASEAYPAPALDSTGRLLMGYSATAITSITRTVTISETGEVVTFTVPAEGQTDLLTLSHVFTRNLTLDDAGLAVSDDHPAPDSNDVILSAAVHNSGDLALDGVVVSFYDGNPSEGGTLIGTATLREPLAAGFTATLTTTYSVPTVGGPRVIYAVADPANAIVEADETDNIASLTAFGPDLEIISADVDYWGGGEIGLRTLIHNIGPSASPTTTVAFYREALTGTLIITDTVPALAPDETVALNTPWTFGALAAGSYPLVAAVNLTDFDEIFTADNIYTFTLDVRPDLMVSPYYLWTTSPTGTTVLVTTTVFNVGAITATDVLVGFYGDDRLSDSDPLFTQTVALLGPGESTTLSGQTAGPLACTLYVYVDPDWAVSETSRANNLAGIDYRGLCERVYLPLVLRNH